MPKINRVILLSGAGLVLLALAAYLIAFRVSGSSGHNDSDTSSVVRLASVDLPEGFRGYGLSKVALADSKVWALGDNGHDPRLMLQSRDKGTSWDVVSLPTAGFTLKDISFPDPENGWVVGSYGTIVHTSDGGKSWMLLKRPTEEDLVSVTFVNDKVGYIGGSKRGFDRAKNRMIYGVVILRTSDGGQSWRTCYEDDRSEYVGRIHALSETHALVVVDRPLITEDSGKTWQPVQADRADLGSIAFTTDGIGCAVSRSGNFYRSLDKGKSWHRLDVSQGLLQRQWWSIDFADAHRGMAVGSGGAIAVTDDSGKTWAEIKTAIQDNLMEVRLRGQSGLILGSRKVYRVAEGF